METPSDSSATEMDAYGAHADNMMWEPTEKVHQWASSRVLTAFTLRSGVLPSESSLLEVGTGSGRIARSAIDQGWNRYVGIEPTHVFADAARAVDPMITVLEVSLPDLPNELSESFDAVVSMNVMEHAASPEVAMKWVLAMAKCLRPGGSLLVAAPDVRDFRWTFWDVDWTHGWPTTPQRIADLLEGVGLELTTVKTMRLGSLSAWSAVGFIVSRLLPTRFLDSVTRRLIGRPLATGAQIGLLWGLSFVIAKKPGGDDRSHHDAESATDVA